MCHPLRLNTANILSAIPCFESLSALRGAYHCSPWHAVLWLALAGKGAMQTSASCSCLFPCLMLQALKDVGALARMVAEGASSAEREAAAEAEQRRAAAEHAQAASDRAAASEQALTVSKARAVKLQQELQAKQQVRFPGAAGGPRHMRSVCGAVQPVAPEDAIKDNGCNSKTGCASSQSFCPSCRSSHAPHLAIAAAS